MVLVNLCNHNLQTKIKCDKPSNDDHDINNLLLDTDRGFMVYPCIKPPINVDFDFMSGVKLSHIIIWPSVGAQKSTGFKISAKSSYNNNCSNVGTQSYCQISSSDLSKTDAGIIFCSGDQTDEFTGQHRNFLIKCLNNKLKVLSNVKSIRLTITRTENYIATLRRVEIWGHILSNELAKHCFKYSSSHLNNITDTVVNDNISSSSQKNEAKEDQLINQPLIKIPDEYLDPITCTIMIQPIILPSGKVIDFKTLEKFGENEALWGRPLSDPFTGVTFSNNYKPIFADLIKSRIDKFITENSNLAEFQKVPRVLGPHGINNSAIQQHRNEMLSMPNIYKRSSFSPSNSASSVRNTLPNVHCSRSTHLEDVRLKHKMPINVNKLKNLTAARRTNLSIKTKKLINSSNNLLINRKVDHSSSNVNNSVANVSLSIKNINPVVESGVNPSVSSINNNVN